MWCWRSKRYGAWLGLGALLAPALAVGAEWQDAPNLAQAVARAAEQHRLLLIQVTSLACPACRRFARTLASPRLAPALRDYACLSYNVDEGEGVDVARRYNVVVHPTVLLVGDNGEERDRITGELDGEAFAAQLGSSRDGRATLERLEHRLVAQPDELELRLQVGRGWALRGDRARAMKALGPLLARPAAAPRALLLIGDQLLLRSLLRYREAEQRLRMLRARYPHEPEAAEALEPLARALHLQGKTPAALELLAREARSGAGHHRLASFCLTARVAPERGLAHAQQAVLLMPREAHYWATLAQLLEGAGKARAAAQAWKQAAALDPADAWYRAHQQGLERQLR